jgi:hypothetical protein
MTPKYNVKNEYINIEQYSPFCHINEVSPQYQTEPFDLLFIDRFSRIIPVHPDTFSDLGLTQSEIVDRKLVYPTSAFRTVYEPEENICYKVPLLRKITRSIRGLTEKELLRSERAAVLLASCPFPMFYFLAERCYYCDDQNFNYIERLMPETECFPWFYVIRSQKFDRDFEMKCVAGIISSWMYYASKNIIFESYHTQNILVDSDANIYYRDLSDVRSSSKADADFVLLPSYYDQLKGFGDLLSLSFDRSVCKQNLDHLFRYDRKLGDKERQIIKELISSEIAKYNLPFPDYSLDYLQESAGRMPKKTALTDWRE